MLSDRELIAQRVATRTEQIIKRARCIMDYVKPADPWAYIPMDARIRAHCAAELQDTLDKMNLNFHANKMQSYERFNDVLCDQGKELPHNTLLHFLVLNEIKKNIKEITRLISINSTHRKSILDVQNALGYTPVHALLTANPTAAIDDIKMLISEKNLELVDDNNSTLLHAAVATGRVELVNLLIELKIDIHATDKDGKTALHYARDSKYSEVTNALTRADLLLKIQAMRDYGKILNDKGVSKGAVAVKLANALESMSHDPLYTAKNFSILLHSEDKAMSDYGIAWGTIVKNILIAMTGIGLLLIAGKLIHSQVTEKRSLFFFQKPQTTSEEKISDIEKSLVTIFQPS